MAKQARRNVKRSGAGGRTAIVRKYNTKAWYELPDWAREWLSDNLGYIALVFAVILTPAVLLATILGAHSLPLVFIGVPISYSNNSIGLAAAVLIVEFIFLAVSVRPLIHQRRVGLNLLVAAGVVRFAHSLILQHGFTGGLLLVIVCYLYWQLRPNFD